MNESKNLQRSFSELLNASSISEIEIRLNEYIRTQSVPKNCLHELGAYVRLSPSINDPRDEGSLKNHPLHIVNYVDRKNSEDKTWGHIKEWYIDSEVSAATLDRPAFQRLLGDLDAGRINGFIVYDLLRASRDVGDFSLLLDFLQERNIRFFSACDQIDLDTPFGRYMVQLKVANGQLERETNIFRLQNGAISRAQRGLAHNNPTLGYNSVPYKKHHKQINKEEAEQVIRHFKSFLDSKIKNLRQWILDTNERGYRTKKYRNKGGKWKGGGKWTLTTAANFFRNKIYISIREYNKKNRDKDQVRLPEQKKYFCAPGIWEPIIDEDLFIAVQEKLKNNGQTKRQYKRHFPLSKLIHCAECGEKLVGVSGTSRDGSKHYYYGHERKMRTRGNRHERRCQVETIRSVEIESEVTGELKRLSRDKALLAELAKKTKSLASRSSESTKALLSSREQERRKLEQSQNNTLDALGSTDSPQVRKLLVTRLEKDAQLLKKVEADMETMKLELVGGRSSVIDLSGVFGVLKEFRENFDQLPPSEKTQVLGSIVKRILIEPDLITMEVYGAKMDPKSRGKKIDRQLGSDGQCSHVVLSGRGGGI